MNTREKFYSMVLINTFTGCHEWNGSLWATGYGRFHFKNKSCKSHRLAWIFSGNELKEDDCLLHKCDNRKCVNPDHLFVGTRADNNYDKTKKGRQAKGEKLGKLRECDILEIRRSCEDSKVLAEKYKVSWGHINKVRGERAWYHVK